MKKIHNFDEVFDGQIVFRALLDATSKPGKQVSVSEQVNKMYGLNKAFLTIAMTLIDNEVSYNTMDNEELKKDISILTLGKEEKIEDADYIFIEEAKNLKEVIGKVKIGTLANPHKSATLIIKMPDNATEEIRIYGAGIDGIKTIMVSDIVTEALNLRDESKYEYPQGIDLIFITESGKIMAIPRLVLREV